MTRAGAMAPMDEAAAQGRIALQRCGECGAGQYPPRALCHRCLADALGWIVQDSVAGHVLAATTLHHSNDKAVALPVHIGLVRLGEGMTAVCFLAEGAAGAVRVTAAADAQGRAVLTGA